MAFVSQTTPGNGQLEQHPSATGAPEHPFQSITPIKKSSCGSNGAQRAAAARREGAHPRPRSREHHQGRGVRSRTPLRGGSVRGFFRLDVQDVIFRDCFCSLQSHKGRNSARASQLSQTLKAIQFHNEVIKLQHWFGFLQFMFRQLKKQE